MTSFFQDGGHDVRPPLAIAHVARLRASPPSACNVIGRLYMRYSSWSIVHSYFLLYM